MTVRAFTFSTAGMGGRDKPGHDDFFEVRAA
jgi:hypothetical protein